jgi:hypothetical protein
MARRNGSDLPGFLRNPMVADMVAAELTAYAQQIQGDDPVTTVRRTTLAQVAVQVAGYGSDGTRTVNGGVHTTEARESYSTAEFE